MIITLLGYVLATSTLFHSTFIHIPGYTISTAKKSVININQNLVRFQRKLYIILTRSDLCHHQHYTHYLFNTEYYILEWSRNCLFQIYNPFNAQSYDINKWYKYITMLVPVDITQIPKTRFKNIFFCWGYIFFWFSSECQCGSHQNFRLVSVYTAVLFWAWPVRITFLCWLYIIMERTIISWYK